MQLHELSKTTTKKKRIGRGGKRGTYSGKGNKGQKARTGNSMRPALRDIVKRFPKTRGYQFKTSSKTAEVTLQKLNASYKDGEQVTLKTLRSKGLAALKDKSAKVIATGDFSRKLELVDIRASKGAREAIEKAGGTFIDTKKVFPKVARKAAKAAAKRAPQQKNKPKAVVKSKTKAPAKQATKAVVKKEAKKSQPTTPKATKAKGKSVEKAEPKKAK